MATPNFASSKNSDEWYTPPHIVELARHAMGSIDLDPASSEIANSTVKAQHYFTQQDNGLTKPWSGNVFLNPPYSMVSQFIDYATDQFIFGLIDNAVVVVNASTDTHWFQPLWNHTIWFPLGRIKFINADGSPSKSPSKGNAVVLLSRDPSVVEKFTNKCYTYGGAVLRRVLRGCPLTTKSQ